MPLGVTLPSLKTMAAKSEAKTSSVKASGWRARLTKASFRGVAFWTETDDLKGGRRAVTHEFPGRDTPYTEDMGRKARTYSVVGYVIGADYMTARDALITALEAEGPGALIVPWMPERKVVCTDFGKTESGKEGGIARFSMTFAERGDTTAPTGQALPGVKASSAADAAAKAAGTVLNRKLVIAGVPVPVQQSTFDAVKKLGSTLSSASGIARTAAGLPALLTKLKNLGLGDFVGALPSDLAGPLFALSGAYSALTSAYATSSGDTSALSSRVSGMLSVAAAAQEVTPPAGAGTVRTQTAANLQAVADYQRTMATVEAARAAALVEPASKAEAATLRTGVMDAMDNALEHTTDASVSSSLLTLRTAALQAITQAAGSAPDVVTVTTTSVAPALALAQRLLVSPGYATSAPEAEVAILARNTVRHPGFVPPGNLEVLRA